MNFIETIKQRARNDLKTIVLPESMDTRIIEAASKIAEEKIAKIILIGNEVEISNSDYLLNDITIIDPNNCDFLEELVCQLVNIRKNKGLTYDEAKKMLLTDYMYFACMLVKTGRADGVVSGACHSTSNTLRPALQIIKAKPDVDLVSSFFLMNVPNCQYGNNGLFIFADCGLEQNPTAEKLATIATRSAVSFKFLL